MRIKKRINREIGNENLKGLNKKWRRICIIIEKRIEKRIKKKEGWRIKENEEKIIEDWNIGDLNRKKKKEKRKERIDEEKRKEVDKRKKWEVRIYEMGDGGVGLLRVIVFE